MKNRVVFRVDGGSRLPRDEERKRGMGHIVRCLALAEELEKRRDVEITFIMKNHPTGVRKVISAGHAVKRLSVGSDADTDVNQIHETLGKIRPHAVVTDILNTRKKYMSRVRETGAFLINVDDLGPGRELADALVYSLVRPPRRSGPKMHAGPSYMTLNDGFKKMHEKKKRIGKRIRSVLVSMGAGDPQFLTSKVINALEKIDLDLNITVVTGPVFTYQAELRKLLDKSRREYDVRSNVENMPELMHDSDIAIISGGVSVYELAAVGTPGIVLCQNKHEDTNVFEEYGFVIKLGLGRLVSVDKIVEAVQRLDNDSSLRRKMSDAGKRLVDGRGAERVADIIVENLGSRAKP